MKSLEKANELVERFTRYTPVEFEEEYAIQCAIIAVDEIIRVTPYEDFRTKNFRQVDKQYWQKVKQHLEEML